jgi:transcription initiation factor TFIID subunit TAF12
VHGEDTIVDLVGSLCLQAVKRADSQQQQQQQQQQSSQHQIIAPPESSSASATMIPLINQLSFTLQIYERRTGLEVSIDKLEVGV